MGRWSKRCFRNRRNNKGGPIQEPDYLNEPKKQANYQIKEIEGFGAMALEMNDLSNAVDAFKRAGILEDPEIIKALHEKITTINKEYNDQLKRGFMEPEIKKKKENLDIAVQKIMDYKENLAKQQE